MRLITYVQNGRPCAGVLVDGGRRVLSARELATEAGLSSREVDACDGMTTLLEAGPGIQAGLKAVLHQPHAGAVPIGDVHLLPPIPRPEKILCLGLNYRDHALETKLAAPTVPVVFPKYANSLIGPEDEVILPAESQQIDYEGELAVVIGTRCKGVSPEEALQYVAGVMVFNDITARDLQFETSQWTLGKAIDTFAPCGPAIVSLDEIADIQALQIETRLNGNLVQSDTTAAMIFPVAETVARLAQNMTLQPGDIIATGTPSGVGYTREPPLFLRENDVIEITIEHVGVLRNRVSLRAREDALTLGALPHSGR
jgi:2-keto-4-pentenoate hydratase/2-oxohepta-3-ene-1,7-dioic acid hydratase in catechol pathway